MAKVPTHILDGQALDWAVFVALGNTPVMVGIEKDVERFRKHTLADGSKADQRTVEAVIATLKPTIYVNADLLTRVPSFHKDWAAAGPLMQEHGIATRQHPTTKNWHAMLSSDLGDSTGAHWVKYIFSPQESRRIRYGSQTSQLVAAMRCLVGAKLGESVTIPDALILEA